MLSRETETFLQSDSVYNERSFKRQRHSYGETRPTMDALLKDGDPSTVRLDLQ